MFDFHLLFSLPKPKGSFFVCLLVLLCLACFYWFFTETTADDLSGSLHEFLLKEQSADAKHPQILVAGASLSGFGFHVGELEKRTGMPVAKISLDGSHVKDTLDILECFSNECQNVKILLLGVSPGGLIYNTNPSKKKIITVEGFAARMNKTRRMYFDKIRGTTTTFSLTTYLARSSLWYFLRLCYKRLEKRYQSQEGFFEKIWDDPRYNAAKEKERILLRKQAEEARKNKEKRISEESVLPKEKVNIPYSKQQTETVYQLLDLCRKRNTLVVVCITPQWYGHHNYTQSDLEKPAIDRNIILLQDINKRPDCTVIICRNFEEITNEGTDEDYLFDYGHMTRKGAMVYSNWLVDRLLENPKTASVIRPNTKP